MSICKVSTKSKLSQLHFLKSSVKCVSRAVDTKNNGNNNLVSFHTDERKHPVNSVTKYTQYTLTVLTDYNTDYPLLPTIRK